MSDAIAGFFASRDALAPDAYLEADYVIECVGDPRAAAAHFAREQSTAQWARPGIAEDLRLRHGAKVVGLDAEPIDGFSVPLPVVPAGAVHRCRVTIAQPLTNIGHNLPALLSMVAGEGTFFTPGVPVARLEDLRFPDAWLAGFRGPRESIAGLRARHRAEGRPLFIGVIKPNLGLAPGDFATLAEAAWQGGLDIAKDDEMLVDTAWSPLATRAAALGAARRRSEGATGRPLGYMANVTDEVDRLRPLHDAAVAGGATALLVNALPVGLSGLRHVAAHATVPVFTHFPMIAALGRVPGFGVHPRVLTRLQRLAGADAVIMPGFGPRMATPPDEVLACVRACLEPMGPIAPSLPCPGGSDWAGTVASVHAALGTVDFGFIAGRGVFGHPDGPGAGAMSIRAAWEAARRGESFEALAQREPVVQRAVGAFGG